MDRIEKYVELNVPVDRVWHALTDFKEFGEWFRVHIDAPFIAGKASTGHITYRGSEHVKWEVQIIKMEILKLFSFAWHPYAINPKIDYSQEKPTVVEFRIKPTSIGTQLTITESGFDALPAHRSSEAFYKNSNGWDQQIQNIQRYLLDFSAEF